MPQKKDRSCKCERPGCKRYAKYNSPKNWCSKHWNMWWYYAEHGKEDAFWMKKSFKPRELPPMVEMAIRSREFIFPHAKN